MKQIEIIDKFNAGNLMLRGRFLLSKAERINYRDKTTKQAATMDKLSHSILTGQGVVFVEEDTRNIPGFSPETYKVQFKEQAQVVVLVSSVKQEMGITTVRGVLHPVET